jgi:hypothetical protein
VSFSFTAKQNEALKVAAGGATHVMLFGGGRSGKTFLHVRNIVTRALKAPGSRHLIVRFRFNHVKQSIILDTFPKVMKLCFPELIKGEHWDLNRTDWYVTLPGSSEIWFGGLDDSDRMEKILGAEYATIYLNECSQISWAGVQILVTRLAQRVMQVMQGAQERLLKPRMLYDCNPPSKAHWTFKVFRQKVDPDTKEPLKSPDNFVSFQMNPRDNQANLSPEYLESLSMLSGRMRRRFEDGEFADATPNALFSEEHIDAWRVTDGIVPDFVRIVVSVDPSGAGDDESNVDNDEIGIVVDALGTDGKAYLLEDLTVKGGPSTWGRVAVDAFTRHGADLIVGETNFGGGMVKSTVQAAAAKLEIRMPPFKAVTASRGKSQRAEPFSALYEHGKVRHVGIFPELEDELCAFSTSGYTGPGSPNRADAHVWAMAELFPSMVATKPNAKDAMPLPTSHRW